jgi:hypothetical protein
MAWMFWGLIHGTAKRFYSFPKFQDGPLGPPSQLMGMRVVSTWVKWVGQEADGFHLGLKLRMNGAILHLSLNAFIVMIALRQIKHELFFLHMWAVPFQECSKDSYK